jgi:hypothetical protein
MSHFTLTRIQTFLKRYNQHCVTANLACFDLLFFGITGPMDVAKAEQKEVY